MSEQSYNYGVVTEIIRAELKRRGRGAASALAAALDVRPQTVSKWVRHENTPGRDKWNAIEDALELERGTFAAAVFGPETKEYGVQAVPITLTLDAVAARLDRLESLMQAVATHLGLNP